MRRIYQIRACLRLLLPVLGTVLICTVGGKVIAQEETPSRFFLRFQSAYLVHTPGGGSLQIAAEGNVLSYGRSWQVRRLKPYLYHMRQRNWQGFYWKVNTSRKKVYRVRNGTFGGYGGSSTALGTQVGITGQGEDPERFILRFQDAYLVHKPGSGSLRIIAENNVLSYGHDWEVQKIKPYLYHMRQRNWQGFYWRVNVSREELHRVRGDSLRDLGRAEQIQNTQVELAGAGEMDTPEPTAGGKTRRTVLADGTIELHKPDGSIRRLRPDGTVETVAPDGTTWTPRAMQVATGDLPPLPDDLSRWGDGVRQQLLGILRNILTETEYQAYLQTENEKGYYELIDWRLQSISFLTSTE